jgi:anti-sigma B factor antagonist
MSLERPGRQSREDRIVAEDEQVPGGEARALREDPVEEVATLEGGAVVVRLAGEIDLYNAHVVRDTLAATQRDAPRRLVVDLGAVGFLDSTALGVLVEARAALADRRAFLLAAPGLEARRALEVSGLDRHFAVHESVEAALAAELA